MLGLGLSLWQPAVYGGASGAAILAGARSNVLALDFRDLSAVVRDAGTPANAFAGDPNSLLTYSSPSAKWVRGGNGLLATGTTLRAEYDGSGSPLGLRHEGARTNLITRSNAFNLWATSSGTLTSAATTAPDGTTTGWLFEANETGPAEEICRIATSQAFSTVHTASIWAKYKNCRYLTLRNLMLAGASPLNQIAFFDLQLGTVNGIGSGVSSAFVETWADGWMRLIMTGTTVASGGNNLFDVGLSSTGTDLAHINGQGAYIFGCQLEPGATASSYMPTTGSTVTRAADNITLAQSAFPWAAGAGTLEIDGVVTSPSTSGSNLQIVPRAGQTHIQSYLWVPS